MRASLRYLFRGHQSATKTEEAHKCSISPDYFSHVKPGADMPSGPAFCARPGLRSGALFPVAARAPLGDRANRDRSSERFRRRLVARMDSQRPCHLTNTDEVPAHGGTRSLKTTGRTAGFNGPSLNAFGLLTKGSTYQVTAWVRLVAGESPTQIRVTMQRTVSGSNSFDSIASSSATGVTDAAWVQLSGLYAFGGNDPSALLLYIESSSATASYYVDDFSIVKIADPPGPPQHQRAGQHV